MVLIVALGSRAEAAKPKAAANRPFADAGYLNVPEGRDVRMGDPSGGLSLIAQRGSLIKRQNKALVLDRGRLGVSMSGNGKAAVRIGAGALVLETAGGKFVVERGATTRVQVLDGKVLVTGAGAARNLTSWQQLEVSGKGKVTIERLASAVRNDALRWIESK